MDTYINLDSQSSIKEGIIRKLLLEFGKNPEDASPQQIYKACALLVRDNMLYRMAQTEKKDRQTKGKKLYYISMEFLMGRSLANNILNLMKTDEFKGALRDLNIDPDMTLDQEEDAGLGNGGLGRLAACFIDSLTTLELPAVGCSIRYEYGLFKQLVKEGKQVEVPDWWLEKGNVWEVKRPEEQIQVKLGGNVENIWVDGRLKVKYHNDETIIAMPYDFPISGYGSKRVNYLRLWQAQATERMDMKAFNRGDHVQAIAKKETDELISKVLYPEDNNPEGKRLRLKQEYFLSSATIQWIVKEYKADYGDDLKGLADRVVIHINDTHPALAIPEMMRILMDEEGLGWDDAWSIVTKTFAYTNHTVMSEALEKWPIYLFKPLLPRLYSIIVEINQRLMERLSRTYPGDRKSMSIWP